MNGVLGQIQRDSRSYRRALDAVLAATAADPPEWRRRLRQVSVCTLRLYLDYLRLNNFLPALERSAKGYRRRRINFHCDPQREFMARKRIAIVLENFPYWGPRYDPANAFSDLTGLRTRQDFNYRFILHLPEIYGETFRVESCAMEFTKSRDDWALVELETGMSHLARNHAGFVLQALDFACHPEVDVDDDSPAPASAAAPRSRPSGRPRSPAAAPRTRKAT